MERMCRENRIKYNIIKIYIYKITLFLLALSSQI